MSCCGSGKLVTFELFDNRLVTLDLDCDEDWGGINIGMKDGIPYLEIGNDEDDYIGVRKCWEEVDDEGNCEDYIDAKYRTFIECDILNVVEWVLVRTLYFSDGYTYDELKDMLKEYGFNPDSVYVPEEWK